MKWHHSHLILTAMSLTLAFCEVLIRNELLWPTLADVNPSPLAVTMEVLAILTTNGDPAQWTTVA